MLTKIANHLLMGAILATSANLTAMDRAAAHPESMYTRAAAAGASAASQPPSSEAVAIGTLVGLARSTATIDVTEALTEPTPAVANDAEITAVTAGASSITHTRTVLDDDNDSITNDRTGAVVDSTPAASARYIKLEDIYHCQTPKSDGTACHFETKYKYNMKQHLDSLGHDNRRGFSCRIEGCTAAFRRANWRDSHECSHTGAKLHNCRYCTQGFSCLSNCSRHETSKHSDKYTPRGAAKPACTRQTAQCSKHGAATVLIASTAAVASASTGADSSAEIGLNLSAAKRICAAAPAAPTAGAADALTGDI